MADLLTFCSVLLFFFFNAPATTEIYTLSLHDALPICWQTQFEKMYPKRVFDCPVYAIPGNHDYQRMPQSKVAAELEYAKAGGTRWTMPSLWYRFEFPAKKPLVTVIALDSNMPFADGSWDRGKDFTLTPAQQAEQLTWLAAELERPQD